MWKAKIEDSTRMKQIKWKKLKIIKSFFKKLKLENKMFQKLYECGKKAIKKTKAFMIFEKCSIF